MRRLRGESSNPYLKKYVFKYSNKKADLSDL